MKGNNTKGKTFFSWNTFNIELERFFSEFRNIFNFMSRNKHLFSVETISMENDSGFECQYTIYKEDYTVPEHQINSHKYQPKKL